MQENNGNIWETMKIKKNNKKTQGNLSNEGPALKIKGKQQNIMEGLNTKEPVEKT